MNGLSALLGASSASQAERRAAAWTAVMFCCALAATFLLRPLRDQLGVDRGVDGQVWLYTLTLLVTAVVVPPFWWLAHRIDRRRLMPTAMHACAGCFLALASLLSLLRGYGWREAPWIGELFWSSYSALNVVVPALVWIHAVEHFDRARAQRSFGWIALGGTGGAVFGSWLAGQLSTWQMPLWGYGVVAAGLVELGLVAYRRALPHCLALHARPAGNSPPPSLWLGSLALLRQGYVARIGLYMLLLGMLATAFYAAQTELVGAQYEAAQAQHRWLAQVETYGQGLVFLLQLFCTARLLQRVPSSLLLMSLPLVSMLGISAWWWFPTAGAFFVVQVARRGAQFALEKPAREVLYTPLDLATKHRAKFLLDTFAFRLGDLLGAMLQAGLRDWQLGVRGIVLGTLALCGLWIVLAWSLSPQRRSIS